MKGLILKLKILKLNDTQTEDERVNTQTEDTQTEDERVNTQTEDEGTETLLWIRNRIPIQPKFMSSFPNFDIIFQV